MTYYQHWTNISRLGDLFAAHCTGCNWHTVAATRPDAVRECKRHQHDADEQREGPANAANVPPVYSGKVARLLNLAVGAENAAEAELAFSKARQLYRSERAA